MIDWTASMIRDLLVKRYDHNKWVCLHELRERPGFQNGPALRTIDFAAMHRWPGENHRFVCVEIKVSRSDFHRELKMPVKSAVWKDAAHEFWFAAPAGVIPTDELPEGCGLLTATKSDTATALAITHPARYRRESSGPTRGMLLMMVRDLCWKRDCQKLTLPLDPGAPTP